MRTDNASQQRAASAVFASVTGGRSLRSHRRLTESLPATDTPHRVSLRTAASCCIQPTAHSPSSAPGFGSLTFGDPAMPAELFHV